MPTAHATWSRSEIILRFDIAFAASFGLKTSGGKRAPSGSSIRGCLRWRPRTNGPPPDRDVVHGGGGALLRRFRTKALGLGADRLDVCDADEAQDLLQI